MAFKKRRLLLSKKKSIVRSTSLSLPKASTYIFVLHSDTTRPSARALTKELSKSSLLKSTLVICGNVSRLEKALLTGATLIGVLNMGFTGALPKATEKSIVLNAPSNIAKSSNKRQSRLSFKDKNVPAPKLWTSSRSILASEFPVVGRTSTHTQGQGFWYCKNKKEAEAAEVNGATHFLKFINNTREFRVHMVASKRGERSAQDYICVKTSEKFYEGLPSAKKDILKNRKNGWIFKYPKDLDRTISSKIKQAAREAMALFDLDWGGVDVMVSNDTLEAYVLEINSCPRLADEHSNTVEKYAAWALHLLGLQNLPFKRPTEPISQPVVKSSVELFDEDIVRGLVSRVFVNKR